jgi:hypothetical protein
MKLKTNLDYVVKLSKTEKTKMVVVISAHDNEVLGRIAWYGKWRCYVFHPLPDIIWSDDCLEELSKYIRNLNMEQKGTW